MRVALVPLLGRLCLCVGVTFDKRTSDDATTRTPSYDLALDNGSQGYYPSHSYFTEKEITSPVANFLTWHPECDDNLYTLVTPRGNAVPQAAPMLLDQRGNLVWTKAYDNAYGGQAYGLDVQTYLGQKYLTFWIGDDRVRGHGSGSYYMLNSSYEKVHEVNALNNLDADLHEFKITPEGTALLTLYHIIEYEPGGRSEPTSAGTVTSLWIWDCLFQEITVESRQVIFQWRASDHVPVADSYRNVVGGSREDPFDYFHINSVEKDHHGNYLISARYLQSIYYIEGETGNVIWTLGGKQNDFQDLSEGSAIDFAWQHDARLHTPNATSEIYQPSTKGDDLETVLISMFDNAAEDHRYDYGVGYSRGLLLEVTYPKGPRQVPARSCSQNTSAAKPDEVPDVNLQKIADINGTCEQYLVRKVQEWMNPERIRSSSQGSMQLMSNVTTGITKVLVGYGLNAAWTQFDAFGTVLCNVHLAARTTWETGEVQSYRTRKASWVGQPNHPPMAVMTNDSMQIHVSWNGATEIAIWALQASIGNAWDGVWNEVQRLSRSGFETTFNLTSDPRGAHNYRVVALDQNDQVLQHGISPILDRQARQISGAILAGFAPAHLARSEVFIVQLVFVFLVVCIVLAF